MKKTFLLILISLFSAAATFAETSGDNSTQGRNKYRPNGRTAVRSYLDSYCSSHIGATFTSISSENKFLGNNSKTGLNVGFKYGMGVTTSAPLYFELGVSYVDKGGKVTGNKGKMSYNLNYLELPFALRYIFETSSDLTIQPFFGGYFACGVGGSVKNYATHTVYISFSDRDDAFRRFDGGIQVGCGFAFDLVYADLAYEIGLANITHDAFNTAHNHGLMLSVGVMF